MTAAYFQALSLLDQGVATIPVSSIDKAPRLFNPREPDKYNAGFARYIKRLPSSEEFDEYFADADSFGILAGSVQCLDVDSKNKPGLWESFQSRCEEFGLGDVLKKPLLQGTINGGVHIVFRCKDVIGNLSGIAKTIKDGKKLGLFDYRGKGGYFVASPSPGYSLLRGDWDRIPELSPDERDDLLAIARSFDEVEPVEIREPTPPALPFGGDGKSPGDAYEEQAEIQLPLLLNKHGWRKCGEHYWRRPGKKRGVSATWGHVKIEGQSRFWVFSSSTEFRVEHAYKAWHVYAVLEHGGDFQAASRELMRQGYGEGRREKPKSNTLAEPLPPIPDEIEEEEEEGEAFLRNPMEAAQAMADKAAKEIEELGSKIELPPILTVNEELEQSWPTPPQIIKGMLYQGAKMMIAGPSKARKTFLLTDLALSVGTGSPWLGFPTIQAPVLYLNFELQAFASRNRTQDIRKAKFASGGEDPLVYFWHLRGQMAKRGIPPQVVYGHIVERVRDFATREGVGLIIIDPVYKLMQLAGEENKAEDVGRMLNEIEAVSQETGAAIAFCHHFAKGNAASKESMDRASGSGVFARDPDALLTMTPHEEEECMIVEANLRNFKAPDAIGIRWNYPVWERDLHLDPEAFKEAAKGSKPGRKKESSTDQLKALLARFGGSVTRENCKDISEAMGVGERTVWNRWKEIKAEGEE